MQLAATILRMLGGWSGIEQHVLNISQHVPTAAKTLWTAGVVKAVAGIYHAVDFADLFQASPYGKSASNAPSQDATCWRLTKV